MLEGVEVVGVGGDDEIGAGAGFDLEAEDLGAGEVGDDLDVGVGALEGVGGFGEGLAEGGGGEDVEFAGGGGVAGGEEEQGEECLEGRGCARKSFFQKTLEAARGAFLAGLGCARGVLEQRALAEGGTRHPKSGLRRRWGYCTLGVDGSQLAVVGVSWSVQQGREGGASQGRQAARLT